MKRTVIFSEGKRDLNLMRLFFYVYHEDVKLDYMVGEEIEYANLKKQESEWFDLLVSDWDDTEVLIKSEEGKENLIEVFTHIVRYVTEYDTRIVFLVDLDEKDVSEVEDRICKKVEGRFRGQRLTVEGSEKRQRGDLALTESSLVSESGDDSPFYIVGFEHSMETSAGIDKDEDDDCAELRKMYELLEEESLWEILDRPVCQGRID